jgi:flagellin FlaB
MAKSNKFAKNDAGFTGLEAAIVLIAFVVVAAVFSYVMLGAGFFTSQKSKEVVHNGVTMATSSVELAGPVYAGGDVANSKLINVTIPLQLTAGNNPVDITKITIAYDTNTYHNASIYDGNDTAQINWIRTSTANNLLESSEMIELIVTIPAEGQIGVNDKAHLVITPANGGASLPLDITVPPAIVPNMQLTY